MFNLSKFEIIRDQLSELRSEISALNAEEKQIPELIEKTNLLRQNELLKKLTKKTSLLLDAYLSYVEILEQLVSKSASVKPNSRKNTRVTKKKKILLMMIIIKVDLIEIYLHNRWALYC